MSVSWYFGFAENSWALYAELAVDRARQTASWLTVLARQGEPLLVVHDDALAAPRRSLEVRGPGLWADLTCHDPARRWQVNFEGIAVALDDPNDASGRAYGDRVPMEFEFEWELASTSAWEVHGEVEIAGYGSLTAVASKGWRGHVSTKS